MQPYTGEFSLESIKMIFSPVHQSSPVIVYYRTSVRESPTCNHKNIEVPYSKFEVNL